MKRKKMAKASLMMWCAAMCVSFLPVAEGYGRNISHEKEDNAHSQQTAPQERVSTSRTQVQTGRATPLGNDGETVTALTPRRNGEVSLTGALLLDLAVPGGGHFYTGETAWGITFASLKIAGAITVYYCFLDWKYRRSLYRAARRANREIDPTHRLEFEDPDGGYMSVDDYEKNYDRAAQRITFALLANVVLYSVSLLCTWHRVSTINENAVPTFDLRYSCADFDDGREMTVVMSWTRRM